MQDSPKESYRDVTGVLLAGGKSRRMGRDKALLELQGKALFERALTLLQRHFPRVLIAGDRPDLARPEVPAIADVFPGSALGGIHAGLSAAATEWIFVAPCDMPFPDPALVEKLLRLRTGADAVVPRTDRGYEPVFALYHKNCLAPMEAQLKQGRYRISELLAELRLNILDAPQLPPGWQRALTNLNTPADYARVREKHMTPPVVSIVARSGTGKTTLLEKLIAELKARGYRVGAIKHDAHSFTIDHEGKDSWRLTRAGADTMLITSPAQIAMVRQNPQGEEPPLAETIASYCSGLDIVLTEGFKHNSMPKIEVHRQACGAPLLCRGEAHDPQLFALASDRPLALDVPVFDLNDARGLVDLIVARFLA